MPRLPTVAARRARARARGDDDLTASLDRIGPRRTRRQTRLYTRARPPIRPRSRSARPRVCVRSQGQTPTATQRNAGTSGPSAGQASAAPHARWQVPPPGPTPSLCVGVRCVSLGIPHTRRLSLLVPRRRMRAGRARQQVLRAGRNAPPRAPRDRRQSQSKARRMEPAGGHRHAVMGGRASGRAWPRSASRSSNVSPALGRTQPPEATWTIASVAPLYGLRHGLVQPLVRDEHACVLEPRTHLLHLASPQASTVTVTRPSRSRHHTGWVGKASRMRPRSRSSVCVQLACQSGALSPHQRRRRARKRLLPAPRARRRRRWLRLSWWFLSSWWHPEPRAIQHALTRL